MLRRIRVFSRGSAALLSCGESLDRLAAPPGSSLPLPKTLVLLAHPDDEVLALGGRLERFSTSRFICATDGAPRDGHDARSHNLSLAAYRKTRRAELIAALRLAGLPRYLARTLTLPGDRRHIADQQAAQHLVSLARAFTREILAFRPDSILTHPYEGGHPDHDACAFAAHTALRLIRCAPPLLLEAAAYHAGPNGIVTNEFLPGGPEPVICRLSVQQQIRKRHRLSCFRTQAETLKQFRTDLELFRPAPAYDFTAPPHPGPLYYEQFPWGMTGELFRQLAARALRELGI